MADGRDGHGEHDRLLIAPVAAGDASDRAARAETIVERHRRLEATGLVTVVKAREP